MHKWGYAWHCPGTSHPLGCRHAHTHSPCPPVPLQPPLISPRVPSLMPAELCPIKWLCPPALDPWHGDVHPAHPACTLQAGLGVGRALGDTGCASAKPHRLTLRATLPETKLQPWLGFVSPTETPKSGDREGVSAISSDTQFARNAFSCSQDSSSSAAETFGTAGQGAAPAGEHKGLIQMSQRPHPRCRR